MNIVKISGPKVWLPYFILLGFLGLTIAFSFIDLGYYNDILTWVFAVIKTYIIMHFYMHITRELQGSKIYFILALLTLLIFVVGVLDDILMRVEN